MPKKSRREARESSLAQGWVVEASETAEAENTVGDPLAYVRADHASPADAPLEGEELAAEADRSERRQLSNGAMVVLGVIGGLYLVYSWIWFSWAQYAASASGPALPYMQGSLGAAIQMTLYWLVPLAPTFWCIAAVLTNRGKPFVHLAAWLLVGAVVLVPLPYFLWTL